MITTMAVEVCPYCGHENIYPNLDVASAGYVAECEECGNKIFLCDECSHAEDNPGQKCDWSASGCIGKCFRGAADNRPSVHFKSRGESGNIFYILGLVSRALSKARRPTDYNTCRDRVTSCGGYREALRIIREYVDLIDDDGEC